MSALTNDDIKRVETIAELKVRQYFDGFNEVLADKLREGRHHTHQMIERHDTDPKAHDRVSARVNKFRWVTHGILLAAGVVWALVQFFYPRK